MAEQGRASRDIMKAAQGTTQLAVQVRKATASRRRAPPRSRRRSIRCGAAPRRRPGRVARAGAGGRRDRAAPPTAWPRMIATVVEGDGRADHRGRRDHRGVATSMRQQADQAAKALKEQARAMKDMTVAAANTAKQIKQITRANREHSAAARRHRQGPRRDRGASPIATPRASSRPAAARADLLRYAEALTAGRRRSRQEAAWIAAPADIRGRQRALVQRSAS